MKRYFATEKYKRLLDARYLLVQSMKRNIPVVESVIDIRCPVCGLKFSNAFLLKRHLETSSCSEEFERLIRSK